MLFFYHKFSPFGFPMVPQTLTQQLLNSPVLPLETSQDFYLLLSVFKHPASVNPMILLIKKWFLLPGLTTPVLFFFQAAAKMSQLGVYVPSVLTNLPAGAAALQPESQAAGLKNPDQQAAGQTAGVPPSQGLPCSGAQPNANSFPAGLERAAPEAATIPAPVNHYSYPVTETRVKF
uniref:Uncharacterized protein n=1 Tax=Nothobranchius furzeri TaxID=105023 RepID=A0A8C6KD20_NOTFU